MKKLFLTIFFVLFSTISFADDNHGHKHKMIEANAPYLTLDVKLIKDTKSCFARSESSILSSPTKN